MEEISVAIAALRKYPIRGEKQGDVRERDQYYHVELQKRRQNSERH